MPGSACTYPAAGALNLSYITDIHSVSTPMLLHQPRHASLNHASGAENVAKSISFFWGEDIWNVEFGILNVECVKFPASRRSGISTCAESISALVIIPHAAGRQHANFTFCILHSEICIH